ncbi:MAG TPA: hypothetical protein VMM60_03020 [Ilumatobacter sp.]|nr:hypothetical protein [Ilumatobacter sp.]
MSDDPWVLLGLDPSASEADVNDARRRLAKASHPDLGGDVAAMQAVNAAADRALASMRGSTPRRTPAGTWQRSSRPTWTGVAAVDHPSFTVEALPVDSFEALVLVATELGRVIDDDPPYRLEFALEGEVRGWCEVTLVPDAGATTVSMVVAAEPGYARPAVEQVRDLLVVGLNRLDWSDGPNLQQP